MRNPFQEHHTSATQDEQLVERAVTGDKDALEELVLRHQAWIYNVALRMVWHPQDAEDVTQEVLIKVCTRLHSFRGAARFRTWVYRIVANHVINMKRGRMEPKVLSFTQYGEALDNAPDLDLPDPSSVPVDVPVLVEEAKIGCLMGMLLCLDRRQRLVFVLGELIGVTDAVGAEILEVTAINFRQLLSRARRDLYHFMNAKCGLVNEANACRCHKKTRAFMEAGYVDPDNLHFVPEHVTAVRDVAESRLDELEHAIDRHHGEIQRQQPFLTPPDVARSLARIFEDATVRSVLRLDG